MSSTNQYNAGVPASTRIESHIPGTQAHRERQFLEHEQGAAYGQQQGFGGQQQGFNPAMNQGYDQTAAGPNAGFQGTGNPNTGFGEFGPGAGTGRTGGTGFGTGHHAGGVGTGVGTGMGTTAATGAAPAPATMRERADELHGRHHGHQGNTSTTTGSTKPHMGDKVMGATQAAVGRALNNPAMEQAGWERKTFGDPKHRPDGVTAGTTTGGAPLQQSVAPGGVPTQQGFNNPNTGFNDGRGNY